MAVQIKDDEIFELLERLAATEEMFKAPVSTIRDVAELTDAPPALIARILADIRGPDEYEKLHHQVQQHNHRLDSVEQRLSNLSRPSVIFSSADFEIRKAETARMVNEWAQRPRDVSVNVKLSAWEVGEENKLSQGFYARKKQGLSKSDIFFLLVFAAAITWWAIFATGSSRNVENPSLPPPYETR